jgi:hypothetical protein
MKGGSSEGGIEVIKKAGYVKKKNRADAPVTDGFLGFVMEAQRGVGGRVEVTGAKLAVTDQRQVINFLAEARSDHFFQKLTATFQKGDGTISFSHRVVGLTQFQDNDN